MAEITKWDYLVVYSSDLSDLNEDSDKTLDELGAEGWELAGVDRGVFYFKKPLETESTAETIKKRIRKQRKKGSR